jgi:two-component system phosphate regulon sensor histidine kinase PhoR
MRDPLKKIIVVFIVVALLPVSFLIYELSSLNRNEAMVREIYQNQLEAILYSVNQYSDDIISSWANRINTTFTQHAGTTWPDSAAMLSALGQLSAVRYLYFSDLKGSSVVYGAQGNAGLKKKVQQVTDGVIEHERRRVRKLIGYQQAGFRKMEAIDTTITRNDMPVFFVLERGGTEQVLGVMIIDLPVFIQNTLGPKMQAISQEKFVISALQQRNDSLVYFTGPGARDVVAARGEAVPAGEGVNEEWQRKARSTRCTSSRFTRSRAIWTEARSSSPTARCGC